jgi:peptide/nickel transport system substrate-binding protein
MTSRKNRLLLSILALLIAACGTGAESPTDGSTSDTTAATQPVDSPGEGGSLVLLQWQAPSQLNPYLSTGTKDSQAGSLVVEPLAEYDTEGQIVPALATEIPTVSNGGISEDLTQITWNLQPDVTWSDGTPLTAEDVVFSWEYCTDELTGCVSGAFQDVVSVEAVDDLTVTLTFDGPKPWPYVPFVGATEPVIQEAQFGDCVGETAVSCTEENFAPIGTGPYMVTEMLPEDTVSYALNPNYRHVADGLPFFETVELKGGGDAESTARSVLEIGEADYAWNLQVAPEILGPMEQGGQGNVEVGFNTTVEYISLNQTNPDHPDNPSDYLDGTNPNPFFLENPELARALSLAINRDEIVDVGYGAAGEPTCNIWPVQGPALSTNNDWCLSQDIEEANRILEEDLAYADTDGDGVRELPDGTPLEFDFVTSTNAVRQSTQDLIAVYWEQIGVRANMRNEDASLFFDGTAASDASIWKFYTDILMFANNAVGRDAQGYLVQWASSEIPESANQWGGQNITRLASDEFDALFRELASTDIEDPARNDLIIQLNDIIVGSSGSTIPLVNRGSVSAFSSSLTGYEAVNGWDSEYWNIEEWRRTN